MLINVYLDINPITKKPFYVGIGTNARVQHIKRNKLHTELVETFPNREFKRIVIYKNIPEYKAYRIEKQIIKRCGKLVDCSGYLTNILDGGDEANLSKTGHYRRGKRCPEISTRQTGKSMKERIGNSEWEDPRKGKTVGEIYGDGYIHPRKGKKLKEYKPKTYIEPKSKPFKIIINDKDVLYFTSESDFIQRTKLTSPMLCKMKRIGNHVIKKLSNSTHIFENNDYLEYFPITFEEYRNCN